jgi:hypothetical protein
VDPAPGGGATEPGGGICVGVLTTAWSPPLRRNSCRGVGALVQRRKLKLKATFESGSSHFRFKR